MSEEFEGENHVLHAFHGSYDGTHPIIMTCTKNNMVTDQVETNAASSLRFHMQPSYELRSDEPMGELMRAHPEFFAITQKELIREKKILPDREWISLPVKQWSRFLQGGKMPDPTAYVYVQYKAEHTAQCPLAIKMVLKDGTIVTSDFDAPGTALEKDGWCQTAVLLPAATAPDDIKEFTFLARTPQGSKTANGQLTRFGHIFYLSRKGDALNDQVHPIELKVPTTL